MSLVASFTNMRFATSLTPLGPRSRWSFGNSAAGHQLLLEDPGGEPLERILGAPMEPGRFLRLAIGIASALGKAHQRGLVHKDIKPANILMNCADGRTRLPGSASPRVCRASVRRPSRPRSSPARSPIWRPSRPGE